MKITFLNYCLQAVFLFVAVSAKSQTIAEKYDLNFQSNIKCTKGWGWVYDFASCRFAFDAADLKNKRPYFKVSYYENPQANRMWFALTKKIILPSNQPGKKCEVSLISKSTVKKGIWLKLTGLDKDGKETSVDSTSVTYDDWGKASATIRLLNTIAIRVNVYYDGDSTVNQYIWLDSVSIRIDGKDIGQSPYDPNKTNPSVANTIDPTKLKLLDANKEDGFLSGLEEEMYGKKIIGLGECTHGSSSIKAANYQFIKALILNHKCSLILLEKPIDVTLTWNQYVQGKLAPNYIEHIIADTKATFSGYLQLVDFLNWLRSYNLKSRRKVHLVGMDSPRNAQLYLFEFNLAVLGKQHGAYYLQKIAAERYDEAFAHAVGDTVLKNKLGIEDFASYLYVLKNESPFAKGIYESFRKRDDDMAERTAKLADIYTKKGEKVAILAHSGHINNLQQADAPSKKDRSLGFLLKKKFKQKYFSISFQIGQGSFIQDECWINGTLVTDTLKLPPSYSFEYAALATGVPYFYYPSKSIGEALLSCHFIPRASRYADLQRFLPLKLSYDGYVFIKESTPIVIAEAFPSLYMMDYLYLKKQKMINTVKELPLE